MGNLADEVAMSDGDWQYPVFVNDWTGVVSQTPASGPAVNVFTLPPTYRKKTMKTIGELQEALARKNPEGEFEILVQNNPDHATNPHAQPEKVVILVANDEFLRLN